MKTNVAILGCGTFGYDLASCLSQSVGKENLYLTNRNESLREKYGLEFSYITANNQEAVQQSDLVCVLVRPQQVNDVLSEINVSNDKLIVNFTPKRLSLDQPLIQVACSPVSDRRIRALLYQKNKNVADEQVRKFREIFSPVTDYFVECDDSVRELGIMSQVYTHLVSYYDALVNEGINPENLETYFDLACKSLKRPKEKVRTREGLTDTLFDFEEKNLPSFVNSEREVLEEKLQWIQTE